MAPINTVPINTLLTMMNIIFIWVVITEESLSIIHVNNYKHVYIGIFTCAHNLFHNNNT